MEYIEMEKITIPEIAVACDMLSQAAAMESKSA